MLWAAACPFGRGPPPTRPPACPALLPGPRRLANHVIAENQYLDFVSGYLG